MARGAGMSTTPKSTIRYTVALALILVTLLFWTGMSGWGDAASFSLSGVAVLFAVALIAGLLDIPFPFPNGASVSFTADSAIALAIGIILGPFWGALLVMASTMLLDIGARRPLLKIVVNNLNLGLSTLVAAHVYHQIGGGSPTPFASSEALVSLLMASFAYTFINLSVLALIVSPIIGISPLAMWLSNIPALIVELVTLPTLGSVIPVLYNEHPLAPALIVVPLAAPFLAFSALRRVEQETKATIESLADALEQRDRYTHHHSVRVTRYATEILDQIPHIPVQTREVILSAARIHDVGKVGISDLTLNKPGQLSPDEWADIQRHAEIGSTIVNRLSIYREEATIVRHHHERWDGSGYPDGLAGEHIPLGSRVISVADALDAMTSDRAYRSGMSPELALSLIRENAGTQFDPDIVEALESAAVRSFGIYMPQRPSAPRPHALTADHGTGGSVVTT